MNEVELGTVENESVLDLMECPVCLDHIVPPIKQCVKGHLVCSDCFPRLAHCPTCRSAMCDERNLAMEQVSRLLNYPCRYNPMGCKEAFPLAKKSEHERNCAFLQLKCPFHGQCTFNGSLPDVIPHLASEHKVNPVPVQPAGTLFYRAKFFFTRNIWTLIFKWQDNLFRLIVKNVHADTVGRQETGCLVVAHIQYIGPESMAAQYGYQISLFRTEDRKTVHECENVVTSTMKPLESLCSDNKVFVAKYSVAKPLADHWGNLNFIVRMKKLNEKKEDQTPSASTSARSRTTTTSSTPAQSTSNNSRNQGETNNNEVTTTQSATASSSSTPAAAASTAAPVASTSSAVTVSS